MTTNEGTPMTPRDMALEARLITRWREKVVAAKAIKYTNVPAVLIPINPISQWGQK